VKTQTVALKFSFRKHTNSFSSPAFPHITRATPTKKTLPLIIVQLLSISGELKPMFFQGKGIIEQLQSVILHRQPNTGYLQPAVGYLQPVFGYLQPMFGYLQPMFGYLQPMFGYLQPMFGYLQPVFGYLQPVFGYLQPVFGYLQPVFDYLQSNFDYLKSVPTNSNLKYNLFPAINHIIVENKLNAQHNMNIKRAYVEFRLHVAIFNI